MQKIIYWTLIACILAACSSKSTSDKTATDSTATDANTPAAIKPISVVIWNAVGVRATPGEKGKYLTSVYLGEHLQLPGDTASEVAGGKRNLYHKATLSDGTVGWVPDQFIAKDIYPAAVIVESPVYKRPDVATISDKTLVPKEFIVAKQSSGEWTEVTAKRIGDSWYTKGFVKTNTLSFESIDAQFAALWRRHVEESKADTKLALQRQLEDANAFGSSSLWKSEYGRHESETQQAELYALLPLDGNAEDASQNTHEGDVNGATATADRAGNANGAMYFNGQSYITLNNSSDQSCKPPFTVAAYFKLDDIQAHDQCVVSRGRSEDGTGFNFGYTLNVSNQPIFYLGFIGSRPLGVECPATLANDEWVHLAATFDMSTARLYVNGKLCASKNISEDEAALLVANLENSSQPVEIGRELATLNRYFRGSIDNVTIYSGALASEKIADLLK